MYPKLWMLQSAILCLSVTRATYALTAFEQHPLKATLQKPEGGHSEPSAEQKELYRSQGGNEVVHETWSLLRRLEPSWKDAGSAVSPSGITSRTWHYVKVVARTLFMNGPVREGSPRLRQISPELRNAVETLELGAQYDDADAISLLADMNYYGNFSHPRNFTAAFDMYRQLEELDGNATAQHMLGHMYATGVGGAVERDQAKAMLYHTFAAEQGNIRSEMTLAFRYYSGVGTGRDCGKAAEYYTRVARKAMSWWESGPPGGHTIQRNAVRWSEYEGGAYGEGASVSSSGPQAYRDNSISASFDDVLEYLDFKERQGDWNAVFTLGKNYYEPPRGYKADVRKAQKQFMKLARAYWDTDGNTWKVKSRPPKGIEKYAAKAAAYLGRMYLRGEGVKQNYEKAVAWFKRGIASGDAFAQYHLGIMYRDGLGFQKDWHKAGSYLLAASEQSLAVAQSAVGVMFLDQGDTETAGRYFELAAAAGVMEGYYYLAELTNKGVGRERNCDLSVIYYKAVAEKAEPLHSALVEANAAYERGDFERAFIASLAAAEQGYENAQANVAHLLDDQTEVLSLPPVPFLSNPLSPIASSRTKRTKLLTEPTLALAYYTRSAKQRNTDSLVKMGDYYLGGVGTISRPVSESDSATQAASSSMAFSSPLSTKNVSYVLADLEKASSCYTTAAEYHSAQALWNLGWMHENGIGPATQDFHLAKRYYDLALESNREAYLPVKLALLKLRIRSWWNSVSGGSVKSIGQDERNDGPRSFWDWLNRFLDNVEELEAQEYAELIRRQEAGDQDAFDFYDPGMPGGDAEYHYDGERGAQHAHDEADGGAGLTEDYLVDVDDGLIESLIIIALAGALALLVYARQRRQQGAGDPEERERQVQQQQNGRIAAQAQPPGQPQQAQGLNDNNDNFFPQPGEAEFANWAAGGIGH